MTTEEGGIRIGELLVRAGVITAADLSEAEKLSSHMKMQFGRLLIMAGCLTEEALECALEAQSLIKEGLLSFDIAIEALGFAVSENMSLKEALELLDVLPQFGTSTLKLAELIGEAAIIADDKLIQSLELSVESNIPLGDVLVAELCIPATLLPLLSRFQEQIRTDSLNRPRALEELRGTFYVWQRADHSIASDPLSHSPIQKERPLSAKSGRDSSRQVFPTAGGGTSYSPPRGPSDRDDDGWIREGSRRGGDKGKASSEEVVIYSDGYFAEHERPTFDGTTFDDIPRLPAVEEISNDDERRINDVLDIFAEDTSTQITPLRDPQYESSFGSHSAGAQAVPTSVPEKSEYAPASQAEHAPSGSSGDGLGLGTPLPVDTIKALQALAFGAPTSKALVSPLSAARPEPAAAPPVPPSTNQSDWRTVESADPDSWRSVDSRPSEPAGNIWDEPEQVEEAQNFDFRTDDFAEPTTSDEHGSDGEDSHNHGSDEHGSDQPESREHGSDQRESHDHGFDQHQSHEQGSHGHGSHGHGSEEQSASVSAHEPANFMPFEIPSAPSRTSQFDQKISGEIKTGLSSIRKVDKASSVFGQLDFGEPEPGHDGKDIPNSDAPADTGRVTSTEGAAAQASLLHAETAEIGEKETPEPQEEIAPARDDRGSEPADILDVPLAEPQEASESQGTESQISSALDPRETEESSAPQGSATESQTPEMVIQLAQSPESFFVHLGQALSDHASNRDQSEREESASTDARSVELDVVSEGSGAERTQETAESTPSTQAEKFESSPEPPLEQPSEQPAEQLSEQAYELDSTQTSETLETATGEFDLSPPVVPLSVVDAPVKGKGKKKGKIAAAAVAAASPTAAPAVAAAEEPSDVVHLLQNAGFFQQAQLQESLLQAMQDATLAPEILRVLGIVDKSVLDAAVRVHKLIKDGTVDVHRAVESLESIRAGKLKPADLTNEFGIKKPKRRK
jgi:hypothetical protein